MSDRRLVLGVVVSVTAALLFATKGVLLKWSFALGADATQMLSLRMAMALPCFLVLFWFHHVRAATPLGARAYASIMGWGLLGYAICPWLDFTGLEYIPVSLERMVLFSYPTLVVLFALARRELRLNAVISTGLLLTYAGIWCTWADRHLHPTAHAGYGVGLVLASAIAYAVFLVGSNGALKRHGDQRFMALAISGAALGVCLHRLLSAPWQAWVAPPAVYGYALGLAIPGTVIPAMLTASGVRLLGPSRFAVVSTIGPLGTVAMAMAFLQERPGPGGWIGIGLTVSGCLVTGLSRAAAPVPARASIPSPLAAGDAVPTPRPDAARAGSTRLGAIQPSAIGSGRGGHRD